jgi:small subunit ribosomal protein S21
MAIRIKARAGESAEQMLRRFKKLCEKEGLTKDVKRKQFYEKPSERRRRSVRKGGPRPMLARDGGRGGSGGGRGAARSGGGRSGGGRSGGGRSSGGSR